MATLLHLRSNHIWNPKGYPLQFAGESHGILKAISYNVPGNLMESQIVPHLMCLGILGDP